MADPVRETAGQMQERVEQAGRIFAEYGPTIRAMIHSHTDTASEEADIYQNLYLSLVCHPVPSSVSNVAGYLHRVIKNDVIDAQRRRKTYQEMISRYATSGVYEESQNDPEENAIRAEEIQRVMACIPALPAHEAKAVAERYGLGRSTTDAAQTMQVKQRTLSRYLCMGLKRIRQAVAEPDMEESVCR